MKEIATFVLENVMDTGCITIMSQQEKEKLSA
jgi:hypothetical protein